VKIHIEEVEERLKTMCPSLDFIITSRLDPVFGEVVVALLPKTYGESDVALFKNATETLPAYWRPKTYVYVDSLPYTETGKPNRSMAKSVASINTSY
jgi:O-succinylbenzoic acid--CoA ligase